MPSVWDVPVLVLQGAFLAEFYYIFPDVGTMFGLVALVAVASCVIWQYRRSFDRGNTDRHH